MPPDPHRLLSGIGQLHGIAANRSESVRWALARIRERPAYQKLGERVRELDELKAQF
jgi:hypothetical protein